MVQSFLEAMKLARAAAAKKAASEKAAAVAPADLAGEKLRTAAEIDRWALRLPGVTPLPHAVRQKTGKGAAPTLPVADKADSGGAKPQPKGSVVDDRQGLPLARLPKQTRHHPLVLKRPKLKPVPVSPPHYPHLPPTRVQAPVAPDEVRLKIAPGAALSWTGGQPVTASVLKRPVEVGRLAQLLVGKEASKRDLVLGFDFGTSCAKVVLGDRGLKQAYAVPFRDAAGIDAFLLPARLYMEDGCYTLHGGEHVFADIKLSLMADPNDHGRQERAVAYLALAIRETRGWLFTVHADSYARTRNIWTLALGQPADRATPGELTKVFARMGRAAWSVAGGQADVTAQTCRAALEEAGKSQPSDAEIEVIVMPEIAAQIYGFVNSNQFDAKARNIFLLADVGAGTVDTCLFRPVPGRGGIWSFEVFTAAVEPTGVMNLHRHRVAWWQQQLDRHPHGASLSAQLDTIRLATEHQAHIPDSFRNYMTGVTPEFSGKASEPDREFFTNQLMSQVQGRTLYRAFSTGTLNPIDLGDVPFFLCGGGARHNFYRGLTDSLRRLHGYTWLSAKSRELAIPNDLRADGLPRPDFDRLSVAYGLSMLNLDTVSAATPAPRLLPEASDQWQKNYVDKDQV